MQKPFTASGKDRVDFIARFSGQQTTHWEDFQSKIADALAQSDVQPESYQSSAPQWKAFQQTLRNIVFYFHWTQFKQHQEWGEDYTIPLSEEALQSEALKLYNQQQQNITWDDVRRDWAQRWHNNYLHSQLQVAAFVDNTGQVVEEHFNPDQVFQKRDQQATLQTEISVIPSQQFSNSPTWQRLKNMFYQNQKNLLGLPPQASLEDLKEKIAETMETELRNTVSMYQGSSILPYHLYDEALRQLASASVWEL